MLHSARGKPGHRRMSPALSVLQYVLLAAMVSTCMAAADARGGADSAADDVPREAEKCATGEDPQVAVPDYYDDIEGDYTLQLEMTDLSKSITYYIHETREYHDMEQFKVNTASVRVTNNATDVVYFYYPTVKKFVVYENGVCNQVTNQESVFQPWGWVDRNPDHGQSHYGPSSILRLVHFITPVVNFVTGPVKVNDVDCVAWKACQDEDTVEIVYYFSIDDYSMPDTPYFSNNKTKFPVQFRTRKMDNTFSYEYNIVQFVPFIIRHKELETPRGADCEDMVNMGNDVPIPRMPEHFSFSQETIFNPVIDGAQKGLQLIDKATLYYSQTLSVIRFDFTPIVPEETPFNSDHPMKSITDYNTGVVYYIDNENGNCTRERLMDKTLHHHHHGIFGHQGEMQGPDDFMKLNGKWAYLGPYYDRHMKDQRWTSTRTDIIDPETGKPFKKAVLEWEFLWMVPDIPVRTDLFIYQDKNPSQLNFSISTNVYDYSALDLYSDGEFDVFECYEHDDFDWSYLLIFFPTTSKEQEAAANNTDLVKHQIFTSILEFGQVSPVRISSIDISNGFQGVRPNYTITTMLTASIRLLENAPYLYSYQQDESGPTIPGVNEKLIADIDNDFDCAEACSLHQDFTCLSFQVCDHKNCYLSKTNGSDGDPVADVTDCQHWVNTLQNVSFVDLTTSEAVRSIRHAIASQSFKLDLYYSEQQMVIPASDVLSFHNPDPENFVRMQFYLQARQYHLLHPNDVFQDMKTMDECEKMCLGIQEYRCETIAYQWNDFTCEVSSVHYLDMSQSDDTASMSNSDILTRTYLTDYRPVLGGVALNSTGPVYDGVEHLEVCARYCTREKSIDCRSFDLCFETQKCRLHKEGFLDSPTGGDYNIQPSCMHFSRASRSDFKEYSSQGLPSSKHTLILSDSTSPTCAQQCIDATTMICESFDFCEKCGDDESKVCGSEGSGLSNTCYLSTLHLGEEGVTLLTAPKCQHYDREYFGDESYASWKNKKIVEQNPYGSGSMFGLAAGMIVVGVLLTGGFLYAMAYAKRGSLSNASMSFSSLKSRFSDSGRS